MKNFYNLYKNQQAKLKATLLALLFPLCISYAGAQGRTISGTVTDGVSNEGLPGATVTVKGTTSGTVTDLDGKYSLTATNEDVLVFSYLGYVNIEETIGSRSVIDVTLQEDIEQLGEVVIVGYGTQEAKDVTGVVNTVGEKDFNRGAIASPDNLISGKMPGVSVTPSTEPGGGANIIIRGATIGNTFPLIVVDGVPLDNSGFSGGRNPLSFINPNDIESMTVLKDASAAAIYGSRASAGVIIITTKSGEAGKPQFSYDGFVSFSTYDDDFGFLSPNNFRAIVGRELGELWTPLMGDANTRWVDEVLQPVTGQNHNFSFRGGNEQTTFNMSVNHMVNRGVVKYSENEITRLNLKVTSKFLNDDLKVTFQTKNAITNDNFPPNVVSTALSFDPTQPIFDANNPQYGGYWEWTDASLAPTNPVSSLEQTINFGENRRSLSAVELDYSLPFVDGLSFYIIASYDFRNGRSNFFAPTTLRVPGGGVSGRLSNSTSQGYTFTLEEFIKYEKELTSIGAKFDVMAGYSFQDVFSENYGHFGNDLTSDIFEFNNPNVAEEIFPISPNRIQNQLQSYFGRVNLSVQDKYIFTSNIRVDGSTRFGPANRYGVFPSAAVGWRIMDEEFMAFMPAAVDDLKLRVGYGIVGDQQIGDYRYETFYSLGTNDATYQFGDQNVLLLRPVAVDPNIKWASTANLNIGLDYGMFNNRFNGSIDVYSRRTTDLLATVPVPAGTNVGDQVTTNVAEVLNTGIEYIANVTAFDRNRFTWNFNFNASYNVNEVVRLFASEDSEAPLERIGISGDVGQFIGVWQAGFPLNSFRTYELDPNGIDLLGETYKDQNGDGQINEDDLVINDNIYPDATFGFTSSITYGSLGLDFTLRGNIGSSVYNNLASAEGWYNRLRETNILNNVHESVLETGYTNRQLKSPVYVEDASFIRMDNITLSYNYNKLDFVNIRLYATAQNLFTLTSYSGQNPEQIGGVDYNPFPLAKTYLFGVNLNF